MSTYKQTQEFETKNKLYYQFYFLLYIILAMSVASESAFSLAGYINRKQRCSLSPTTIRYLMVFNKIKIVYCKKNKTAFECQLIVFVTFSNEIALSYKICRSTDSIHESTTDQSTRYTLTSETVYTKIFY